MKQAILLTYLFLCVLAVSAQPLLRVEPSVLRKDVSVDLLDVSYEEVSKVSITNTSSRFLQVRWDRLVVQQPGNWEVSICDDLRTYPPFVNSNLDLGFGVNSPIELSPGESFDLYLNVKPYGSAGRATIEIPLSLLTDPGKVVQRAVFHVGIDDRQRPTRQASESRSATLYPNPAVDRFYVNLPAGQELGRVEIYNTLGRRVRNFPHTQDGLSYDVSGLPEGVYLVSLIDRSGKVIKTMRLLHRNFRP